MTTPSSIPEPKTAASANRIAAALSRAPWRVIGLAILVVVLVNVDLDRVFAQFGRIGPVSIAGAAAAFAALVAARCWRWRMLTRAIGVDEPILSNVSSCNRSIWLGLATPGRIGEFRRALDVAERRQWSLAAAGALVLFDLAIDFGVYVAFALGGLAYFFVSPTAGVAIWIALFSTAAIALIFGGAGIGVGARVIPLLLRAPGAAEIIPALQSGLKGPRALAMLIATGASTAAFVIMITCLVEPMDVSLSAAEMVTTIGLASAAGAIPISYFGLGTREAALIWFLGERGVDESAALAVSFTYLLATLIGVVVSLAADLALSRQSRKEQ